jgi:hypothetical protein
MGPTRAATESDILPGQINIAPGDTIAPSGLYMSGHNLFLFMVAADRVVSDGQGGALMRGVIIENSEVGAGSLAFTFFLLQAVCGNHIIWNATSIHDVRVRHVGSTTFARAFRGFEGELRRYRDAGECEGRDIVAARNMVLGTSKDDVIDTLVKYTRSFGLNLPRIRLTAAYEVAEQHEDWCGPPNTLWGVVSGLTHASQAAGYADDRTVIDRLAGKLLTMAAS